jgi:hypothetical protein
MTIIENKLNTIRLDFYEKIMHISADERTAFIKTELAPVCVKCGFKSITRTELQNTVKFI